MKLMPLLTVFLLTLPAACDRSANTAAENLLLVFGDQEQGVEPYKTRILVTPDYMRFDDGEGATDYLLFDRKEKAIYSVVQESKSITVITAEPMSVKPPFDLKLNHRMVDDMQDAPTMMGIKPQHHVYLSGEDVCFEVVSAPGFLSAYVEAMKEFNTVLANDSALTVNNLPADMQNGCDLAKGVFAPNRHFQGGFPLQLWGPDGTRSQLLDFKQGHQPDKTLFEIPAGYNRVNIQEIRANLSSS